MENLPRNDRRMMPAAAGAAAASRDGSLHGSIRSAARPASGSSSHGAFASGSSAPPKPDPNMMVTAAEFQRALEIREAVFASDKIDTAIKAPDKRQPLLPFNLNPDPDTIGRLTDYDYAQCAITIGSLDTEVIVDRLYKLQSFRKEYKIYDTVEEGMGLIYKLMQLFPGYILSVDFAPRYGSYIFVFDFAAFFPERLQTREHMRIYMGGLYYIFKCLSTNLKAVRSGVVFIAECEGTSQANFDMALEEKFMYELTSYFPFRHKECLWLNTPTVANIAYALLKPLVTREFLATWRMGCKLDGYEGRIDSLFKTPTQAIAQEQLLGRIDKFLAQRHRNEFEFELLERMVEPQRPPSPPPQPAVAAAAAAGGNAAEAGANQEGPAN